MLQEIITNLENISKNSAHIKKSDYFKSIRDLLFNAREWFTEDTSLREIMYCIKNNIVLEPVCYCGKKLRFLNNLVGFRTYCSCKCKSNCPKNKELTKQTCLEKYGTDNVSKSIRVINKIKDTKLSRYGDETYNNPEQVKKNCLEKYGVESPNSLESVKQKKRESFFKKYGVEHQSQISEIHEKQQKYRWKHYTFPSGKTINIQGYENLALDELLKTYTEDEIVTSRKDIPAIWYFTSDGKKHRYYADIFIPKDNLIVEVKSHYTYKKYFEINIAKENATKLLYNFKLLVY